MLDLFEGSTVSIEPLAARMRPRRLEEFIGQNHIVGPDCLLRRAIDADQLSSLIFHGPPGTGKTTLARIIAGSTQSRFVTLNAVLSGVADIRREIAAAKNAQNFHAHRTILFVDEVHRWSKSQQDALLPWVENGMVVLIGATTENPYFEVNKALVSRSRIFQLNPLDESNLMDVAKEALEDEERGYGRWRVEFEAGALEHLVHVSSGDARSLLNAMQLAVETTPERFPPAQGEHIFISMASAEQSIQKCLVLYDKEGDYHFDTISAFIKSIRGSDPDATLYWLALMIRAGEDPRFIFRRMLISACEDVGLAAPEALGVVESCAAAFDRVGLPEGQYHLSHAALYLSTCLKSNSSLGYFDALKAVNEERSETVPNHLRDANRDGQAFGHGEGYKDPHAQRDHWVVQQYLPAGLANRVFYRPGELGYEGTVRDIVLSRREAKTAQALRGEYDAPWEPTHLPGDDVRGIRRIDSGHEKFSVLVREALFETWKPKRHHRVLIPSDTAGILVWEAHRLVPEGSVTLLCAHRESYDALSRLAGGLGTSTRPHIMLGSPDTLSSDSRFDAVLGRNWLFSMSGEPSESEKTLETVAKLCEDGGTLLLAEPYPESSARLSDLIPPNIRDRETEKLLKEHEEKLVKEISIDRSSMIQKLKKHGWHTTAATVKVIEEKHIITESLLDSWFSTENPGRYGERMANRMGTELWAEIGARLKTLLPGRAFRWKMGLLLINAQKMSAKNKSEHTDTL